MFKRRCTPHFSEAVVHWKSSTRRTIHVGFAFWLRCRWLETNIDRKMDLDQAAAFGGVAGVGIQNSSEEREGNHFVFTEVSTITYADGWCLYILQVRECYFKV